jgi:hypothetical protein
MIKTILLSFLLVARVCLADNAPAAPDAPTPAVIRKFSKFDSIIDDTVREATQTRQSDPLKFISNDMKVVSGDLAQDQTGQATQQKEAAVAGQLDDVIKLLEQQCKSGTGASLNPMKPLADSKRGGGPGGIHELTDPKASDKQWGNLSPKQRDQILQSKTDGFPQGYETLLQSYYKRLAEEQVTDDKSVAPAAATGSTAPTTAPSH